jgi:DNA-binding CsgD family transcriptional regulator
MTGYGIRTSTAVEGGTMSNAGTSILWSSAPSRETSKVRKAASTVWSYYAQVSIDSPHGRVASGDAIESFLVNGVDQVPIGRPIEAPGLGTKAGLGPARSDMREWGPWSLTQRELEVLQLLTEGATNGEISQRLFISPKTAKNHLAAIFQKLDVTNRTQALVRAVVMGLVNIE